MLDLSVENIKIPFIFSETERTLLYIFLYDLCNTNNVSMWYQPQYNLRTKEIVGVEALLRWYKNGKDFVSPFIIFDLIKRAELNLFVDYYITKKVCEDIPLIIEKCNNKNLKVAINLTGSTFKNKEAVNRLLNLIKTYGIKPKNIVFELTENIYLDECEIENTSIIVAELNKKGYSVAIDDFGIKNSSLEMLNYINVDTLKIDKSFLEDSIKTHNILEGILFLSNKLKLKTIGEGIETKEQEDLLKVLGCEIGQGYYFSKPKPLCEL